MARTLASRVKWARDIAGVSQERLAETCGLSGAHISLIEADKRRNLTWQTLARLAAGLGVSAEWLMTGKGPTPSEEQIRAAHEEAA